MDAMYAIKHYSLPKLTKITKHSNETFDYFCSNYNNLLVPGVGIGVLKKFVSF